MAQLTESDYQAYEEDLELLVETLRQSFDADKARYYVAGHRNALFIEIGGLEELSDEEIQEVAGPVLDELDLDFDEISLLPYG